LLAWAPGILFIAGILGDFLDGYTARRWRRPTRFGGILDTEFVAVGTLLGALLAILYQRLPLWYLLVGLGHYIFYFLIWFRRNRGMPVVPLGKSSFRRLVGGMNSVLIAVAITPALQGSTIVALSLPCAALIASSFLIDWAAVCKPSAEAEGSLNSMLIKALAVIKRN
jgi:CDP-diacylglycerol--glycerol-3-phosphate 3-phosphatidyltransferase